MLQVYSFGSRINLFCQAQKRKAKSVTLWITHVLTLEGTVLKQINGIRMNIKLFCSPCQPFPILLWSWVEKETHQSQTITDDKACNLTIRYIGDVLSINNTNFANWIPLVYPIVYKIMETTVTTSSVSCLDIDFKCDTNDKLSNIPYYKRDD